MSRCLAVAGVSDEVAMGERGGTVDQRTLRPTHRGVWGGTKGIIVVHYVRDGHIIAQWKPAALSHLPYSASC
jgi:hypothetical protein